MTKEERAYKDAINKWGLWSQIWMAVEECAELIVAINKLHRDGNTSNNTLYRVLEEIADVEIMMSQLRAGFGQSASDRVDEVKEQKVDRLLKMLDNDSKLN